KNFDLLEGEAVFEQQAEDVRLKAETARIRVPAHHIVAQMHRQPIVIFQMKSADQIDQGDIGPRQKAPMPAAAFVGDIIGNDDIGRSDFLKYLDHRALRLGRVAANDTVVLSFTDKGGVYVVLRPSDVGLVTTQEDAFRWIGADIFFEEVGRTVARAVV